MKLNWMKEKKANDCAEYNVMAFCGKFLRIKDIDKYI